MFGKESHEMQEILMGCDPQKCNTGLDVTSSKFTYLENSCVYLTVALSQYPMPLNTTLNSSDNH